ncbi:MAG: hypothetical protein Hals2KO_30940 [Halioglobus sp.]
MDLYLVRHGEAAASWGQSADPGLSELGRQQAEEAASVLLPGLAPAVQLVSSPLARAQETAQPLARHLRAQVDVNAAFAEVPSPVPLAQRQVWLRQFMQQQWAEQDTGLLGWRDKAYETLLDAAAPTVVFTHFLVINAVVGRIQGRAETLCFYPDNGSITHLRQSGNTLELVELGREMETRVN